MRRWIRFEHQGEHGFGTLDGGVITIYEGGMFVAPTATELTLALGAVTVLTPTEPSKMIALWNNFHALAQKLEMPIPEEPLYLIKTSNSFLATGGTIRRPESYDGKVVYEGELGIVVGATCSEVPEDQAEACIFGYTCVNDVTAIDVIKKDPTFDQWVRAKSFDTFGAFGPVVVSGLDPTGLTVRTVLNGVERQNYPISDMIHPPARLVSMISRDMTLFPGDVIACGTSVGVGSMKEAVNTIAVTIEGIGTLSNTFEQ
jgi:2-keto-4-pentenoate hydratase/2-oxohepta-3-ene-1,7-dioic acid hydratase in catechol pathway